MLEFNGIFLLEYRWLMLSLKWLKEMLEMFSARQWKNTMQKYWLWEAMDTERLKGSKFLHLNQNKMFAFTLHFQFLFNSTNLYCIYTSCRAVLGSVSDYCAHHAHCTVMIVKKPKPKH
ncbi:hypothetical protein B296_00034820 [Ensete ventricosum]|uniref:UspA domain-containing protein n=1 Tax=Ensete ventricosum TaxID=4639 RepID=A0A426YAW1_ENSVE|nr:hypothetical protein B296_00034820 [Ensete ventricosum]